MRGKLRDGSLDAQDYYRQLLRLVYRLLVLFVAEDRNILFHPDASDVARKRYKGYYSTVRLRHLAEQPVIETGPYRLIRHPSYTGFLITLLGLGLSLTNWLSLLVIMGCALLGVSYRIHVEEHVLQAQLGQRYQEYMRRTKRLIPFVL